MPKFLNLISQSGKQEFVDMTEFNKNPNAYGKYKVRMVDDSTGKNYDIPATMLKQAQKDGLRAWNMDKQTAQPQPTAKQQPTPTAQPSTPTASPKTPTQTYTPTPQPPSDWGYSEIVNPQGLQPFGAPPAMTMAEQKAKNQIQAALDVINGRKADGTNAERDSYQRAAQQRTRSAVKQMNDQIEYATATGQPLVDEFNVKNLREIDNFTPTGNEGKGFSMLNFGVAPTVARDEKGIPVLNDQGMPVKGMVHDEVRASNQRQMEAAARQRELGLHKKTIDEKIADAKKRAAELEKKLKGGLGTQLYQGKYGMVDTDRRNIRLELNNLEQEIRSLEAVRDKDDLALGGFFRALDNTVFTAKTWDFGISDLAAMGKMEEIKSKLDRKESLTDDEIAFANSQIGANSAMALEDEQMGNVYRYTKIGGESLPYMADFILTGGYAGLSKWGARQGLNAAAKLFTTKLGRGIAQMGGRNIAAATLKNTGVLIGDLTGAYAMATTIQAGKTTADILKRHQGDLYVDENGDFKFEGGESLLSAAARGVNAAMIENYTEKLGEHLPGINVPKIFAKAGLRNASRFLSNMTSKEWYKTVSKISNRAGVQGYPSEVIEEYINIPLNAAIVGDNSMSELLDPQTHGDILGGMALSIGMLGAVGLGGHLVNKSTRRLAYNRYNNLLNKANSAASQSFGDNWEGDMKDAIDNTTNENMGAMIAFVKNHPKMTEQQRTDALTYIDRLIKVRGFNLGLNAQMNDDTTPPQPYRSVVVNVNAQSGVEPFAVISYDEDGNLIERKKFMDEEKAQAYKEKLDIQRMDNDAQNVFSSIFIKDTDGSLRRQMNDMLSTIGMRVADIQYILNKSPFKRTDEEQNAIDQMVQFASQLVYPENEVHEEFDNQNGQDLADGTPVGDQPTIDTVNSRQANARQQWDSVANPDLQSAIADLVSKGNTTNDIFQYLIDNEYSEDIISAFAELCNAEAFKDGFISRTGEKINDEVEQQVSNVTFNGTLNGQQQPSIVTVTDEQGNQYTLTGGNITVDQNGVMSSDGLVIMRDQAGNFIQRPDTNGLIFGGQMSVDDYRNQLLTQTQEAVTAQIQSTEAPMVEDQSQDPSLQPPTQDLQPTTPPANTQPQEQQQQQSPSIPVDENNSPLYHKAPIEATVENLYNGELDEEDIPGFITANINDAFSEYDKLSKKKPKITSDKAKYVQAKKDWQQKLDEAKQKLDYWHNVEQYIQQQTHTTDAEIKSAQDELSGANAQAEFAAQNGEEAKTPVQVAGEFIKDAKLLSDDFRKETGLSRKEELQFPGMFARDGKTIAQLAEALVSYDNDNYNGMYFKGDDMEARNAIIEALQTAGGRASLGRNTSAEFEAFDRERTQQREDYYEETYHMSYSDYLAFEEQQMPSIWRRISNFAPEQYDQMVAEYYESLPEDYFTHQNQNNNGTEQNPPVAGSNEILPQPPTNNETGTGQRQDPAAETGNGGKGDNTNDEVSGDALNDGSYQLSDELDENGRQFVLNSKGGLEFGYISDETGLKSAPILLSEGIITNPKTGDGYGLVHIEFRHGDQIRKAGYKSVIDFIEEVGNNYEVIREGKDRFGNQTYLLQLTDKHNNTLIVELSGDGSYWNINTAGIFKRNYARNNKEVYNRHTTTKQSVETAEASQGAEQSDTQTPSSMNAPTPSEGKDTTKSPNSQENQQKTDEKSDEGQKDDVNAEIKKDIEAFIAESTHDVEITNYDEKNYEAQISVDGKPSNIVVTPPMEMEEGMHAEYRPTDSSYQELGDLLDEYNETVDRKDQGLAAEHLAATFTSVDAAINFENWLNEKNNPNIWENMTEEEKIAAIDADEIADENAKELAKDFLRGENTGTIAELFYREIVGRAIDKEGSEQKPEKKPASEQKPKSDKPKTEQKTEKPKAERPNTETPKQEKKSDTKQAFDEFKDVMKKFRNAGRADANVSLIGLNSRQIEMLADVFRATAKLGYAMVKDGATVFNDWLEKMRAMVGDTIKENSPWNDQDITDLLTETWNNKYLVDGVRKPLSEWAAEEALNTEQEQEKKEEKAPAQPATVPDNSVVGQSQFPYTKEQAERNFVNSVTDALTQAMKTGEKPYKSIVDIRNAARKAGMEIEDGKDDIKLQELVEDALVKVARDIMNEARIPGEWDRHKFRKETFEKIKLLYNLQPTISMRSSNRVALQQYSTPLPMAFCADMFASGRIMRMFYSAFEPTAGNGMLVFGIPSNRVHVNEIDENRLENLRGQGFKKVTSQDATMPFEGDEYYDAIITNPPFGEAAAKDYDGYQISGLAPQIALNALSKMRDFGRAVIIIGGEQKFASNGAIQNDKPFLAYLYDHYNVKGVIDMDGSLYAKQGTTFPTRMILIDGRRTEEERAKSNVYPPVQKNWIPKADSFDKLYDTVNNIINSNEKTNGNIVLREGQLDVPVSDNTPGQIDERGHQGESEKGDRPVERVRGGLAPSNGSLLVQQDGNGKPDGGRGRTGGRGDNRPGDRRNDGRMGSGEEQPSTLPPTGSGQERRTDTSGRGNAGVSGEQSGHMDSSVHTGRRTGTGDGTVLKEEQKRDLTTDKLPYRSHNTSTSLESVAPAAMVEAMDATLKKIEEEEGNIDEFVTRELGYDSIDEMHKALAAEQVDSVAMAIYNMKNGDGMVIGDQTGVGKGRQMASLIRWAVRQGKKPIFITKDANLFSDMYRDLADIGSNNLRPFIFNASNGKNPGVMTDENGKVVYSALTENQQKKIFQSGTLPNEYDYAILSYSQVSTGDPESKSLASKIGAKKKQSTTSKPRSDAKAVFLRKLAKDNYILMDESQGAAGKSNTGAYMQTIVKDAKAVVFASATFAKTPETMPLYALRTAMSKANVEVEKLLDIIKKGGVTLQEIMSRALTTAGQMVRRERDMTDVVTDWKTISDPATVKKARENYDKTIRAFNGIIEFQNKYVGSKLEQMSKDLANMASSATKKKGTDKMGIGNPPFVSKTFNYTSQLMLALKVDAIVDEVVKEIEAGRHPVIALDNTMESAIEGYSAGDTVKDVTFAAPLLKGLDKVMEYTVKSPMGDVNQKLTPESLGAEGAAAYYELENMIRESTGDVFVSPLDAIIEKLQERGYTVGELTGRKDRLVRQADGTYKVQSRGKVDKKGIARDFNSGKIDVVILNKSAATGISLHSSKRFKDQRQRTMIVAQALKDINDYMQMMGRIDRTGQIHRGYYINLGLPVPAENRLMMMLSTKLKSLNANTTTSQSNKDNDVKTLDILNRYGGQVILEYLKDNPDIYPKLQDPFKIGDDLKKLDKVKIDDDTASKVTGRVALLDTDEQEAFYNDVAQRYKDLIDYLDSTNSNELKIQVLPLRAQTISKRVSSKGVDPNGDNPFAQNAYVEQVEVDVLRKPMKAKEIEATQKRLLGDFNSPLEFISSIRKRIDAQRKEREDKENTRYEKDKADSQEKIKKNIDKIDASTKLTPEQKRDAIDKLIKESRKAIEDKHQKNLENIQNESDALLMRFNTFNIGETYLVPTNVYDLMFDDSSPAIFCGFKTSKDKLTPSTSIGIFATLDGRRRVEVKLSDNVAINNIKKHTNDNYYAATQTSLSNWDSQIPNQTRENRYILTGNILQAINDSMTTEGSFPGQIVTYSDIDGNTHDGILMPANWQPSMMASAGSPISSKLEDIKRGEIITSSDGKIKIETKVRNWGEPKYLVHVPKSKQKSGKIYQNDEIAKLVDGVFYQKNNKFVGEVYESNLPKMLDVLSRMGVRVADESSDNTTRLAYSNSTNNVNNSRIIPEDVDKSVSLQIESEFDAAIDNATKELSENDKRYVMSTLLSDMNSFAHMQQWKLEEEYKYYKQQVEQDERRNQRNLQVQRPSGRKADGGISEAQNLALLACIERERSYRERRAVRLSESLGLTAGKPITIDELDKIYKQINKDPRLNEIFDKTISIAKRLGSSIEVANEDASGKGNFGESGTKRDLHYYIEAFCRTASSKQELPVVILHELIHQATTGAISIVKKDKAEGILTKQQIDAVNTIFDIYNKSLENKNLFSENDRGLLNEYEFAAQMADPRQRRALQGFDKEDLSVLDRIIRAAKQLKSQGDTSLWDRIKKAIKTLLNIPDALDKMDDAIDTLLDTFNENVNDILMNDIDQNKWGYTSTQLFDKYPTWLSGQTTGTGQHTTQITSTVNTYKKIGDWMKSQGMDGASVLDASSGLGKGTEALRDMGFNVEDVEPYPSENRTAPTYLKYEDIKGKYDVVISNAVLNVIPDDWRADVLKNMADKVKPGGKMIINVRDAKEMERQKQKIELDSPSEILVTDKAGNIRAYQKGFTQKELADWIQSELGEGWIIETAKPSNSGISGRAVVVTRNTDSPLRYRKVTDSMQPTLANQENQSQMRAHAEAIADKLNTKLTFTTSDKLEGEKKNAKGWYDKKTGQVVIVLDNNKDNFDIEQTVIHEVVGHKGLRALLGSKGLYRLLDSIYANMDEQSKKAINERTMRNGWRQYTAIEEYLAEQAENTVWDAKSASLWQNVKHYLTEALRTLGFMIRPNLKDARYWLWLSKNNLKRNNVMSEIKRLALLNKIERMGAPKIEDNNNDTLGDLKYLYRDGNYIDSATYDAIEQNLKKKAFYWKEAFIDYMQAYQVFQNELAKGLKNGLMDNQNALWGENALTSAIEQQQSDFQRLQLRPLQDLIKSMRYEFGSGREGIRNIENYLMMKHGLERNRVLFMRDWYKAESERKIKSSGELSPEAEYIYEKMEQAIWQDFDDGNIDEKERDKQLAIALNDAHQQYLSDTMSQFSRIKNDELENYELGIQSLAEAYQNIDDFINQHATFDPNNHDMSGLTALKEYFSGNKYEDDKIISEVESSDHKIGLDKATELMNAVQNVSQFALDEDYKNGLVTKEGYNRAKNMFRYYIPLRGFDDTTMEDVYGYMTYSNGTGSKSLVHANGRFSKAGSPIATASNMAQNAIARGLRNQNKQRAYRLVNTWLKDNPTSVPPAIITDLWVSTDSNGNDIVHTPNITDNMNAEEIQNEVENFNETMKFLESQGKVSKVKSEASFRHRFSSDNHKYEHIVPLMLNGKAKMIVFNGNPRPAQALRGDLAPTVNKDSALERIFGEFQRIMAGAFTSYNPSFMATNLIRDTGFANNNIAVKEGLKYWGKFTGNQVALLSKDIGSYARLKWSYDKGISPRNKMEQYFFEFMRNGGKTGFVNQSDIERLQKKLWNYNKQLSIHGKILKIIYSLPEGIRAINERIENINRFATYVTSREMGRSVMRSIYDAKEVSVNFNRKGAGSNTGKATNATKGMKFVSVLAAISRIFYLFFNAGMQSFNLLAKNLGNKPYKASIYTVGIPILFGGFIIPMFNQLLAEFFGDGDDDPYANLPEWTRRNNFCFYLGHGFWLKIPLPIELRAFYGIGDIAAGYLINNNLKSEKNIALDIVGQLSQILPVDFLGEGGSIEAALTPDAAKPYIQIKTNRDWTGKPIYKDNEWNKYEPEYTKAFKGEFEPFVNLSKWINEVSGGSDHVKGSWDGTWNNPAIWHAIIQGYGGGAVMDVVRFGNIARRVYYGDYKNFSANSVPIIKAVLDTPTEKTQYYRMLNKFYNYMNESDKFEHDLKVWRESDAPLEHSKYLYHTNPDKPSAEYRRFSIMKDYEEGERQINNILKNPNLTEAEKEVFEEIKIKMKVEAVKRCDQIE